MVRSPGARSPRRPPEPCRLASCCRPVRSRESHPAPSARLAGGSSSSRRRVKSTRALPGLAAPVRAAVARARAATNFGYRRLVLIAVATRAGCCPIAIAELTSTGATVELTVRQVPCGTCPATGAGIQVLLVSVPRTTFPLPVRLGVGVQPPPTCPAGYSYAGFVSTPAVALTATLTMRRLPTLVTPMDHALAYASIVARDAQEVPRAWLQAGIGRGAIGTYADDGRAWIYVEAQTAAGGYQLTEIAPATAGVPVTVSFAGQRVVMDGRRRRQGGLRGRSRPAGDRDLDGGRGVPGDRRRHLSVARLLARTASCPRATSEASCRSSTRRPTAGACVWGSVRPSGDVTSEGDLGMSDLTAQLDEARERWNTLRHPFYLRWERGELRREDLALYSGQYRHAVVALADLAAKDGDSEHAREERAHVALWDDFVAACGGAPADPVPETQAFVAALAGAARGRRGGRGSLCARGLAAADLGDEARRPRRPLRVRARERRHRVLPRSCRARQGACRRSGRAASPVRTAARRRRFAGRRLRWRPTGGCSTASSARCARRRGRS